MVILGILNAALAGSISGHIHGIDGNPIEAATIYAINPGLQAAQTTTDDAGAFLLLGLPSGSYRLWVRPEDGDAHLARYYPDAAVYCDGQLFDVDRGNIDVDLALPLGVSFSGRVVDGDGDGVGGVRVRGESESGATPRNSTSAVDGAFQINGLDPDHLWKIQASKTGLPTQWWGQTYKRDDAREIEANQDHPIGDWTLLEGITVRGEVLGPDGPVSDATVRVYSSRQLIQTVTNLDGEYHVSGLPPGEVTAWAEAPGLATTYMPDHDRPTESIPIVEENSTVDNLDIHMPRESTFAIQLQGEAPRTNGDLSDLNLMLYNDTQTVARAGISDAEGTVEWNALHGGRYSVLAYGGDAGHPDDWIRTQDGAVATFEVEAERDQPTITTTLPTANTIEGVVVDEYEQPIAGAIVVVTPSDLHDTGQTDVSEAIFIEKTNAAGVFSIIGVPEGLWDVRSQVTPNCDGDPGYVTRYWPAEDDPLMASPLQVHLSAPVDALRFVLAVDNDHDQMGDKWERRYGLDTERDDASEDPDEDGLSNLVEFRLRTDPLSPEGYWEVTRTCGCVATHGVPNPVWLPILMVLVNRRRDGGVPHTQVHPDDRTWIDSS